MSLAGDSGRPVGRESRADPRRLWFQDTEILGMNIVKAYIPLDPSNSGGKNGDAGAFGGDPSSQLQEMYGDEYLRGDRARREEGADLVEGRKQEHRRHQSAGLVSGIAAVDESEAFSSEA